MKGDQVTFRYRMPNGRDGDQFHTTDLECTDDCYEVTPLGRLIRVVTRNPLKRPLEDLDYTGWLDLNSCIGEFRLAFSGGVLIAIQIMDDDSWTKFDASSYLI